MDMRADVLIVGAGMVGSALALALQGSGLQVLLLDGSALSVKPFDPEVLFSTLLHWLDREKPSAIDPADRTSRHPETLAT